MAYERPDKICVNFDKGQRQRVEQVAAMLHTTRSCIIRNCIEIGLGMLERNWG
jgi:hypothetical protein